MWPELQALLFAWNASIHQPGLPEQMVAEAFPKERFTKFLLERACPTVWLPPKPTQEPLVPTESKGPVRRFMTWVRSLVTVR